MTKSYIWSFGSRFCHIALIVSFALSYILIEIGASLYYHAVFGVVFGVAIAFRVIWGFIGTKYSKFSDFKFKGIMEYLLPTHTQEKHYTGHNPASSIAAVVIMVLGAIVLVSGLMMYGLSENSGVFAFLYDHYGKFRFVQNVHFISSNLLLWVVIVHICGAIIDKFIDKNDTVDSMISGYKKTSINVSISMSKAQKVFCVFWVAAIVCMGAYLAFYRSNIILQSRASKIDYANLNKDFAKECGSCHIIYPTFLLPQKAWEVMMSNLEDHFGDDASIDDETNRNILEFLVKNAAQNVDNKIAFNILQNAKDDEISITKYSYWIDSHKNIDEKVFKYVDIKSKSNCSACHKNIENGIIQKSLINYKKL
ncbi:cytochrome b/b6 domain-containing protein [Campylobacter fetus]|uniref:cytochrome b/b6 domain-containing protein n=1 Tax=Campylobacter fetus TaxID=196 RepID=UPI0013D480D4|nr:cytochrome b/b6 domain-containing protein [Campylobacter fetus]